LKDIGDIDKATLGWLNNINAKTWGIYLFDNQVEVENVTNNLVESLNSWVGKYKSMSIIIFLEKE
jgi:hypothetical protein